MHVMMQVHVDGLMGTHYLDNLDQRTSTPGAEDAVRFTGEVDRIYTGCHSTIQAGYLGSGCEAPDRTVGCLSVGITVFLLFYIFLNTQDQL